MFGCVIYTSFQTSMYDSVNQIAPSKKKKKKLRQLFSINKVNTYPSLSLENTNNNNGCCGLSLALLINSIVIYFPRHVIIRYSN